MAVAVKNSMEAAPRQPIDPVAMGSLLGALYFLGSIATVFYVIPMLWGMALSPLIGGEAGLNLTFVDTALKMVVILAAAVGLAVGGLRLAGPAMPAGMKAGIFVAVSSIIGISLLTLGIGRLLERSIGSPALGSAIMVVLGLGLLVLVARAFLSAGMRRALLQLQEQGWFTAAGYKKTQGQRVRRGTILGILVLAGCGIYTLVSNKTLDFGPSSWAVTIPFTAGMTLPLLPDVKFTVPILLTALTLWLAYRIVNYPTFADFLIATEAEINKVSWTTRKRLAQDTIVVLTTVVLMTFFIFVVDVIWGWGLSKVGVLQLPDENQTKKAQQIDW